MTELWVSHNRHKTLLQFHIIFVCKYRKPLLQNVNMSENVKRLSQIICNKHDVTIKVMETNDDHIHYMIETPPTIALSDIIRVLKSYTTHHLWILFPEFLTTQFWKEKTFWTDGYFVASVGNVSEKTLNDYIKNQG